MTAACEAFDALVNRVLDGDRPAADLDSDTHARACPACRQATAALFSGLAELRPPVVPVGFADRATRAILADVRRRRAVRFAKRSGVLAVAAGVLVAVWLSSRPVPATPVPRPDVAAVTTPAIEASFADAGTAVVSLTKKTTDETLAPARNLLAPAPRPSEVKTTGKRETLAELPQNARAGLEPLANTARRAVNLFVRDVGGLAPAPKSKS